MANQQQELPVNNQTQAVLSKYGITAPKKITNIQNIQNKTETDIKIVQPDINISAPNIQINPVEIAIQRYKNWVESSYGRQKILAAKQKQDLEEKDYEIGKSLNRVFRKIEDLRGHIIEKSRGFKKKLDSSMSSLVTLFVASMIPVIWKPLMKRIESIEQGFRYLFLGEIPPGMSDDPDSFTFARTIRQFLGMDDSEGKSLFQGIGDLISEGVSKLIEFLDIQKDDRYQAVQEVLKKPMPDLKVLSLKESIGNQFEYIGDIAAALFGGSATMMKRANRNEAIKEISEDKSKFEEVRGVSVKKALKDVKLENKTSQQASFYLSELAAKYINTKDSKEYQKLQLLFSEIEKLSKTDQGATVSEDFMYKFFGKEKTEELVKNKKVKVSHLEWEAGNPYFGNSSLGYVEINGKQAKPVVILKNQDIQDLIKTEGKDIYSEGRESFVNFLDTRHTALHGKDVSEKAIEKVGNLRYQQINEQTKRRLDELGTSEKYKHLHNFGTYTGNVSRPKLGENIDTLTSNEELSNKVVEQAEKDMGRITYKYGELSYNKTDCSGYISNVYKKFGVNVPRGSINICKDANEGQKAKWIDVSEDSRSAFRQGTYEPNWEKLKPGDIMVWSRYGSDHTKDRAGYSYAGHVSLYTGKTDNEGKPIILGHSGPGPDSDKPEVKGTKREGLNDLRSYLGTVRYNLDEASKSLPTTTQEKGDPGDEVEKPEENKQGSKKITPSVEEKKEDTTPMIDSIIIPKEKQFPEPASYYLADNNTPTLPTVSSISEKVSESEQNKQNTEVSKENRDKYYTDILNNVSVSLANCVTSVELKKAHAKEMMG